MSSKFNFLIKSLVISSAVFVFSIWSVASAAAPTGSAATLTGSSATTVTITVTGTDFSTFVVSGTSTAGAIDRGMILYNGLNPSAAVVTNATTLTLTFPIAVGTGKSGGSLTIAAGTVQDAASVDNLLITIVDGSITDNAPPQVLTVSPADGTAGVIRSSDVVVTFSEPMTTASLAFSTSPVETYTDAWTVGNTIATLSHAAVFNGSTSYTASIAVGTTDAATVPNALAAQYDWTFITRSSSTGGSVSTSEDNTVTCADGTIATSSDLCSVSSEEDEDVSEDADVAETTPTTTEPDDCLPGYSFSPSTGKSCGAGVSTTSTSTNAKSYAFGQGLVKMGVTGDSCKAWQKFFNDKAGANLVLDGICGKLTMAAAVAWQASVGLVADGLLGPLSRAKALGQ